MSGALCDMATMQRRVRRVCPVHRAAEYGTFRLYFDTSRVFFDCGTLLDFGYGYYQRPKQSRFYSLRRVPLEASRPPRITRAEFRSLVAV